MADNVARQKAMSAVMRSEVGQSEKEEWTRNKKKTGMQNGRQEHKTCVSERAPVVRTSPMAGQFSGRPGAVQTCSEGRAWAMMLALIHLFRPKRREWPGWSVVRR